MGCQSFGLMAIYPAIYTGSIPAITFPSKFMHVDYRVVCALIKGEQLFITLNRIFDQSVFTEIGWVILGYGILTFSSISCLDFVFFSKNQEGKIMNCTLAKTGMV